MATPKNKIEKSESNSKKGLDDWNSRLDNNLESKEHNDIDADKNAKDFSEKFGSGDQSNDSEN